MKNFQILRTDKKIDLCFYIAGWVCIALAVFFAIAVKCGLFRFLDPVPPCSLHTLTGYYCPGCGGTRAVIALFHGHPLRSLYYHPIVIYTALVGGWFMISQTIERASRGKIAIGMHYRDLYMWIALLIIVLNCLIKNLILALTGVSLLG